MSRKTFISIKRGLSQDPKHRERMGNRVWLFMHIIDRADFETGVVYDWKDKQEAEDMGINWRTLQRQRQELEDLQYIACELTGRGLNLKVYNWHNPRSYSGTMLNPRPDALTKTEDEYEEEYAEIGTLSTHESTQTVITDLRTPSMEITDHNPQLKAVKPKREKTAPPPKEKTKVDLYPIALAVSEVCRLDLQANRAMIFREVKLLSASAVPPTPELIKKNYNGDPNAFWKARDWRGKRGDLPTPSSIRQTWGQWIEPGRPEPAPVTQADLDLGTRLLEAQQSIQARTQSLKGPAHATPTTR